jgi:hypothetical protein
VDERAVNVEQNKFYHAREANRCRTSRQRSSRRSFSVSG